jgi:small GTP-binding protein
MLVRLIENTFHENHNVTIGVEFGNYVMRIDNRHIIQLQIWDTAGQESYRSITRIFYKGSHAVILVYDITSAVSYENARDWKKEIENNADQEVLVYLVGNRCDLEEEREISTEEGVQLMNEMELDHHMETSALSGHNISNMFETLTKHLYLANSGKLNEFANASNND